MKRRHSLLMGLILCLTASATAIAAPPPVRLRGTIEDVSTASLTIAARDGSHPVVAIDPSTSINTLVRADLADIKSGDFIGTAAMPGNGNELRAMEVVIFPEAARGTGEGHYDWDLAPGSSMTNATVQAAVQGVDGRSLKLAYKGGETTVNVPPGVPIVRPVPASTADLVAGAAVFVVAERSAEGAFKARRIVVEKGGVVPPM
ncbi:hypothetical protein SAMN07250955_101119 [Arboricoccus pini]|uniref:DUF5666 domain-containing protein n=1 Tax=Arboricoccus pini TaxID=1963835 RepID=A0A212PXA8_9PROT|nr:hypothetical protein [Arboricoccus pini]SNB51656.1 hypothetical protein SAMN07250955_101119 [Arboricoccus pini]